MDEGFIAAILQNFKRYLKVFFLVFSIIAFHVFILFAAIHNLKKASAVLIITGLIYLALFYSLIGRQWIKRFISPTVKKLALHLGPLLKSQWKGIPLMQTSFLILLYAGFFIWLFFDSVGNRIRIRSIFGGLFFYFLLFLTSANRLKVNWRPVIGGSILQFVFAFLILRWPPGSVGFQWISEKMVYFLNFTSYGTRYVYGFVANPPNICGFGNVFFFTAMQIIIYFGAIVSVLYYFGVIQAVLMTLARIMQFTVGTTAAESLNAAACIILGQTEAAILIERSLSTMTASEIHTVMTAGFACIAGSLFAAYISFGACPIYLLSATVMSASVSLSVSKLVYPELEVSRQKKASDFKFAKIEEESVIECISSGAVHTVKLIFAVAANLIVYLALLALLNTVMVWAGGLVGLKDFTFNKIVGYCFFPIAYMMGASDAKDSSIEFDETMKVAELMGIKTVLNEFIAYQRLSQMIAEGTLNGARAKMIATYSLCGFSNIGMIGNQIGILSSMCPEKRSTVAKVAIRAFISGVFSCFLTACVAGSLIDTPIVCESTANSQNCVSLGGNFNLTLT